MQPKVILSLAWAEAQRMSDSDLDTVLDIRLDSAVPASASGLCPRCRNHPHDSMVQHFAPESATSTPKQVKVRATVTCLCGTTYWYADVHGLDVPQPIGQARVRAASDAAPQPPLPEPLPPGSMLISTPQRVQQQRVPQSWFYTGVPPLVLGVPVWE